MATVISPLAASRKLSGMSQQEMAKRLGWTQAKVSTFENKPEKARLENLGAWYHAVNDEGKILIEKLVNDLFL